MVTLGLIYLFFKSKKREMKAVVTEGDCPNCFLCDASFSFVTKWPMVGACICIHCEVFIRFHTSIFFVKRTALRDVPFCMRPSPPSGGSVVQNLYSSWRRWLVDKLQICVCIRGYSRRPVLASEVRFL